MNMMKIGEAISRYRKELHISQKRLCRGICTQSTLSKIEYGGLYPSKEQMDALLQRLDMPSKHYYALLSKKDYQIQDLKRRVAICNAKGAFMEALDLLDEMEKLSDLKECMIHQFIRRSRTISGRRTVSGVVSYSNQERLQHLEEAIRMTIPDFQIKTIGEELLCFEEVKTIMNLANTYSMMNDQDTALEIYEKLYSYVKQSYKEIEEDATVIPMMAYNYSKILMRMERYEDSVEISEQGLGYCMKYDNISRLGALLVNRAICLSELDSTFPKQRAFIQANYVLKSLGQNGYVELLQSYAKEMLNLNLK